MFYSTGRFLMGIVTVGLVLVISVQIMMGFEQTRDYLRWAEGRLGIIDQPEAQQVSSVISEDSVTIKLLNSGDYPDVRVLLNNESAYYFETEYVQIPVWDGDLLILDTRGINEALWFEVIDFSPNVSSIKRGQQFRLKNEMEVIEVIVEQGNRF